jgi:hypothetical protein
MRRARRRTPPAGAVGAAEGGGFTRTLGFFKTHPEVTQAIIADAGGLAVCGRALANVAVDHAESAVEALCVLSG